MSNMDQSTNKHTGPNVAADAGNVAKLHAKIKAAYTKLSDEDINLYDKQRDQFFVKLQEKQNVSKVDGEKAMRDMEIACGCAPGKAA